MIEPMEREEAGRPGRRDWLDVDEAWAILLDVRRDLAALPPLSQLCPHGAGAGNPMQTPGYLKPDRADAALIAAEYARLEPDR